MRLRFPLSLLAPFAALTLPLGAQGDALFVDYLSGDLVQTSLTAPGTQTIIGNYAKFVEGLEYGPGGVLFALRSSGQLDAVDPSDASFSVIGTMNALPGHLWSGLAFDSSTSTLFASSTTGNSASAIYTVDTTTGTASLVGTTSAAGGLVDIAIDATGNMFGHDIDGNDIFAIDSTNATATLIGPTGFIGTTSFHGMDFDDATGVLYMIAHNGINNDNNLRTVDLTTGATTDLGSVIVATGTLAIPASGGDDCPAPASSTTRNAGTNPNSLTASAPVLGSTLSVSVDLAGTTGHNSALVVGFQSPLNLPLGGGQTLLVNVLDPGGELFGFALRGGPIATFTAPIPSDVAFCGFSFSAQAIHFGGVSPFALSNAADLVIGS